MSHKQDAKLPSLHTKIGMHCYFSAHKANDHPTISLNADKVRREAHDWKMKTNWINQGPISKILDPKPSLMTFAL